MRATLPNIFAKYKPHINRFQYTMAALVLAFSTVAGVLAPRLASALGSSSGVEINEIVANPATGNEWVELYNDSDSTVDISHWKIEDNSNFYIIPPNTEIPAHGYFVAEPGGGSKLLNGGETVTLLKHNTGGSFETVDTKAYTLLDAGESFGRSPDGSDNWVTFTPDQVTKNSANHVAGPSTHLAAEEFVTVNGSYKGISVGFNAKHFGNVTDITAVLERADGTEVTKTGGPGVLNLINGAGWDAGSGKLTTPFVIQEGSFTEAGDKDGSGDLYWNPAPAPWNTTTTPVKVTINVTDENGTETVVNTNFNQGSPSWPTYESLLVTPSTNDINRTNGWAHVNELSKGVGEVELEFVSTRAFASCFEYRSDGDTSQQQDPDNFNIEITDGLYPYYCLNNETQVHTLNANEYVEVRMVFGAEKDERFDWTRFNVLADTTKPTIEILNPAADTSHKGTLNINVKAQDNGSGIGQAVVNLYNSGGHVAPCVNENGGGASPYEFTCSVNTTAHADGAYFIKTNARDLSGNLSQTLTRSFTFDNTPSNGVFTSPANLDPVSGDFTIEVEIDDALSGLGNQQIVMRNTSGAVAGNWSYNVKTGTSNTISGPTGTFNYSGNQNAGTLKITFNTADLPADGQYNLRLFTKDALGNGRSNIYASMLVDNTAPAKVGGLQIRKGHSASGQLLGCDGYTNSAQIRIEWNHSPESDVDYYWFGTKFNSKHKKVDASKNFYHGNMTPGNNPYFYTVIAVDKAGNESLISDTCGVILDTDNPVVNITDPAAGSIVSNVLVDGTVEDDNLSFFNIELSKIGDPDWNFTTQKQFAGLGQTLYELNDFDLLGAGWYGTCDGQPCSTWGGGTLPDGEYKIRINAYDKAGNRTIYSHNFTLDSTAPSSEITSHNDGDAVNGVIEVRGSVVDDNPHHYYTVIKNSSGAVVGGPGTVNETSSFTDQLLFNFDTSALADGTYTLWLAARDAAGNREDSVSLATIDILADNTAPTVDAGDDGNVTGLEYGLAGTASDAETGVASTLWTLVSGPGTATFDDDSALGTDVTVSDFGIYTFKLTVTDDAGNVSEDIVEITFEAPVLGFQITRSGSGDQSNQNGGNTSNQNNQENKEQNNAEENQVLSQTTGNDDGENDNTKDTEVIATTAGNFNIFSWWWALALVALLFGGYYYLTRPSKSKN